MEKLCNAKFNQKKAGVAMLILNKVHFKTKLSGTKRDNI